MIRLLIVDDHAVVREGLRLLFATVPGIEVVGMAADGAVAVEQVRALAPDVVLMDLGMPEVDGVEATRRIVAQYPDVKIVVLTSYTDEDRMIAALDAGALGYVLKHSEADVVVRAVQAAYVGESVLDPAAARMLARGDCQVEAKWHISLSFHHHECGCVSVSCFRQFFIACLTGSFLRFDFSSLARRSPPRPRLQGGERFGWCVWAFGLASPVALWAAPAHAYRHSCCAPSLSRRQRKCAGPYGRTLAASIRAHLLIRVRAGQEGHASFPA